MGPLTGRAAPTRAMTGSGLVVLAIGAVVLAVGWWGGVDLVTRLHPDLVSMKANTAVGFVLLGIGLLSLAGRVPRGVGTGAAVLLGALGLATALQYATGADLGIDELLARDTNLVGTRFPGRMGLNTAIGFAMLAPAVVLAPPGRALRGRLAAQALAAATSILAGLALFGYVLGVVEVRGLGSATQMAIHTSVLLLLGCLGIAARTIDVGLLSVLDSHRHAGRTARLLVPTATAALVAVAVSTEQLARVGLLADARLQLAFNVVLGIVVLLVGILLLAHRLDQAERQLARSREDLVRLVGSMGDLYLQVDADDVVVGVLGTDHDLLVPGPDVGLPLESVVVRLVRAEVQATVDVARTGATVDSTLVVGRDDRARRFTVRAIALDDGDVGVVVRPAPADAAAQPPTPAAPAVPDAVAERDERAADGATRP